MITVKYKNYIGVRTATAVDVYRYDNSGMYDRVAHVKKKCFCDEDVIEVILAIDSLEVEDNG